MITREEYLERIELLRAAIERTRAELRSVPILGMLYRPLDRAAAWILPYIALSRDERRKAEHEAERRRLDAEWDALWASMTDAERAKWERFGASLADVVNASTISLKADEL